RVVIEEFLELAKRIPARKRHDGPPESSRQRPGRPLFHARTAPSGDIDLYQGALMDAVDDLIIGAGALGLACAARLARPQRSLLIVEAEGLIGSHCSSRNSEVIHAGLYYPPGSRKAELCLEGRERLYAWCAQHDVAHRRIGKLLVAVEHAEVARLEALQANARACGVNELQALDACQLGDRKSARLNSSHV